MLFAASPALEHLVELVDRDRRRENELHRESSIGENRIDLSRARQGRQVATRESNVPIVVRERDLTVVRTREILVEIARGASIEAGHDHSWKPPARWIRRVRRSPPQLPLLLRHAGKTP
jgi:hypothetical protein